MKKLILILLLMLIGFVLVGKSVTSTVPLPELINSYSLAADESQIYIVDNEGTQEWELHVTEIK